MKKKVLIVGNGCAGAAIDIIKNAGVNPDSVVVVEGKDTREPSLEEVQAELKEIEMKLIPRYDSKVFIPKKIHPKHQKRNKYNR